MPIMSRLQAYGSYFKVDKAKDSAHSYLEMKIFDIKELMRENSLKQNEIKYELIDFGSKNNIDDNIKNIIIHESPIETKKLF